MRKCCSAGILLLWDSHYILEPLCHSFRRYSVRKQHSDFRYTSNKKFLYKEKKEVGSRRGDTHNVTFKPTCSILDYETLDPCTGKSIVQQRFDALAHSALLRYGPAPPPVVYEKFCSSARCKLVLACDISKEWALHANGLYNNEASIIFQDEVRLKIPELLLHLRKEKPTFSIRNDCGNVPFSLLIKNCLYFQAFKGHVWYMRVVKVVKSSSSAEREASNAAGKHWYGKIISDNVEGNFLKRGVPHVPNEMNLRSEKNKGSDKWRSMSSMASSDFSYLVFSLDKYKYKEPASQDGLRCGPQPWLYSARQF